MEPRKPPEHNLEVSADRAHVKDVVKGVLHAIFFHRFFTPLFPASHDVLDLTLPYVSDAEVEALVEARAAALVRQLDVASSSSSSSKSSAAARATLVVQFLEKKRRKGWFVAKADEETVWEAWQVEVTLLAARSEPEAARNRRLMEHALHAAVMRVVALANRDRNHIPPITTNDANPFPYQVLVNPTPNKLEGVGQKMGIF